MGTDIYERFEIRRNGVWELTELLPDFDPGTATEDKFTAYGNHPAFVDRNYALFSVLADVRNTFGIRPIVHPRGLPEDASPQVEAYFDGDCTVSWVTLDELQDYDWDQIITDSRRPHANPESLREAVEPFLSRNLPYLLAQVEDPSDFRIVFSFG
ncbi:hypothetical protein [Deinococcus sp. NW-56]|uniref:hypothetical protein n=1 Tax=Deinococcus sp. NW-56 TaxID=2080419 RepID=UPI00131A3E8F|nr:hypothetical protein [Deinococcus sp. NW-56]